MSKRIFSSLQVAGLLLTLLGASPVALGQAVSFSVTTYATSSTRSDTYSVAVADVNGDGRPDVLTTNVSSSTLTVLLGSGGGKLVSQAPAISTGANSAPYSVAVADVNGDGKLDAVVANSFSSTLGVLLGNGNGGFTLQANSPSTGYNM